jgi:hypothetical protein
MSRLGFNQPVQVLRGQGLATEQLTSVAEAMDFLQRWPVGRRGPVYRCALNSCSAAMAAQISAEDARKAFSSFARITGILVTEFRADSIALKQDITANRTLR